MRSAYSRGLMLVVTLSAILHMVIIFTAGISPDQVNQLALGADFAKTGRVQPVAQEMSGGGRKPGSLYQLLLGVPMKAWFDYRAPRVLMAVFSLAAVLLLARVFRDAGGERLALAYTALFALSPWLLYHVAACVDISFLFLPAAAHLWACWRLRNERFGAASLVLGLSLITTAQIHGSFLILVLLTIALLVKRAIQVDFRWMAAGLALGALTLIPTVYAAVTNTLPQVSPRQGYLGLGIVQFYPFLKGLGFWFRMSSPDIGHALRDNDYGWAGGSASAWDTVTNVIGALAIAAIVISLVANYWLAKQQPQDEQTQDEQAQAGAVSLRWLRSYAGSAFIALAISSALSPVVLQVWHVLPALAAACIPLACWISARWDRLAAWQRAAIYGTIALRVIVFLLLAIGNQSFTKVAPLTPAVREIVPDHVAARALPPGG